MIKYCMEVYQCCSNVIRNIISINIITYFKYFNNTVFMMMFYCLFLSTIEIKGEFN